MLFCYIKCLTICHVRIEITDLILGFIRNVTTHRSLESMLCFCDLYVAIYCKTFIQPPTYHHLFPLSQSQVMVLYPVPEPGSY